MEEKNILVVVQPVCVVSTTDYGSRRISFDSAKSVSFGDARVHARS